jgi:hypothetical protein
MRRPLLLAVAALLLAGCDLDYPALGLYRDVTPGGQEQIDQGFVVDVITPVDLPGIWLAAHRSSHGSSFANLVNARVGDQLTYGGVNYVVVRTAIVNDAWTPRYLGPLVLQTSLPGDDNLLVICEPAGAPPPGTATASLRAVRLP